MASFSRDVTYLHHCIQLPAISEKMALDQILLYPLIQSKLALRLIHDKKVLNAELHAHEKRYPRTTSLKQLCYDFVDNKGADGLNVFSQITDRPWEACTFTQNECLPDFELKETACFLQLLSRCPGFYCLFLWLLPPWRRSHYVILFSE